MCRKNAIIQVIVENKTLNYKNKLKGSDYQLTGSMSGTPLAAQNTPDGLPPSSLSVQQVNHLQGLQPYSHDYNNYPTLPVSKNENILLYSFLSLIIILMDTVEFTLYF